jgi:hypothetical protein
MLLLNQGGYDSLSTVLHILGIIFIVLLVVTVAAVLWLRSRIRKLVENIGGGEGIRIPARIHLVPEPSPAYQNSEKVESCAQSFTMLDFKEIGAFRIPEMQGVILSAFVNEEKNLYGIAYEHPVAGVFSDICAYYRGGGSLTSSNAPQGGKLDQREGHHKVYNREATIAQLMALLGENLEQIPLRPLSEESFAVDFEKAYAEEMDWRASRGGPTEEEVRRIAAGGKKGISDDAVAETMKVQSVMASNHLVFACQETFLKESGLTALEWEKIRGRLLVIHEKMDIDTAIGYLTQDTDVSVSTLLTDDERKSVNGKEAFRRANGRMPEGLKLEKVGEVGEPVSADFYLARE